MCGRVVHLPLKWDVAFGGGEVPSRRRRLGGIAMHKPTPASSRKPRSDGYTITKGTGGKIP